MKFVVQSSDDFICRLSFHPRAKIPRFADILSLKLRVVTVQKMCCGAK